LGALIASQVAPAGSQGIRNSGELAKAIVERAKSGETVDLTWLGDKTCFAAEGRYAPHYAKEWFPGYEINDDQWRDKSNGVWHMLVADDKERVVRIY
jgi:hypothetical protein